MSSCQAMNRHLNASPKLSLTSQHLPHAWGGSVMIVVCVLVIRIVKPTKMEKDKASWGYLCKS